MKLMAFSVRDAKVESWSQPFFLRTIGEAERFFSDQANAGRESLLPMLAAHPEDFAMYLVGTFDDATGVLESGQAMEISRGANVARKELRVS